MQIDARLKLRAEEAFLRDPDYRIWMGIEQHFATENAWIAGETRLPKRIADDADWIGLSRVYIVLGEKTPESRLDPECGEVFASDEFALLEVRSRQVS